MAEVCSTARGPHDSYNESAAALSPEVCTVIPLVWCVAADPNVTGWPRDGRCVTGWPRDERGMG